jgi:hypothetical protein
MQSASEASPLTAEVGWPGALGGGHAVGLAASLTVSDLLDGHVTLDLECLDRVYLNGYVPNLQVGGQVVSFITARPGYPIPSPAIMERIGRAFRTSVRLHLEGDHVPVVRFHKGDRKIEVMGRYLAAQAPVRGDVRATQGGYRLSW